MITTPFDDINFIDLQTAIRNQNVQELQNCIARIGNSESFQIYNDLKQALLHAKALVAALVENNYEKSLALDLESFDCVDVEHVILSVQRNKYESKRYKEVHLSILSLISNNLVRLDDVQTSIKLRTELLNYFERLMNKHGKYINYAEKRHYIKTLSNYAHCLFITDEYQKALELCERGLKESFRLKKNYSLCYLLKTKTTCMYKLGHYEESKKTYYCLLELTPYSEIYKPLDELEKLIPSEYPLLKS